jgi:STE24 endopeptidase
MVFSEDPPVQPHVEGSASRSPAQSVRGRLQRSSATGSDAGRSRTSNLVYRLTALALLGVCAWLLWATAVPADLVVQPVDIDRTFGAQLVADTRHYERFFYVDRALSQIVLIAVLLLYARRGASFARESAAGPIGTGIFLGVLGLALAWLVLLPFRIAEHWWARHEETTSVGYLDWLIGDWKGLALKLLLTCFVALVLMGLARRLGEWWWLPGAVALASVLALFLFLAPYADLSARPLEDESLRETAASYERELQLDGVRLRVVEVSQSTTVSWAIAQGIGPSRRILFSDTALMPPFTESEHRITLAHELAHHSRRHLVEAIGWFLVFALPGAWILMRSTRSRGGMGAPQAMPTALLVIVVLLLAATPAANAISRRMEREADWTALEVTSDPKSAVALMAHAAETSFADPEPPRWAQVLFLTHPTLADRVALARAWAERDAR